MNEVAGMAMYEAKKAKKVYLYKNGLKHGQPKCMVVNDRHIRDFSTFLNRVTSGIRAPVAVRNIYTPQGGHPVNKLDDLHSGQYYVAGGSEQFKKIKYGEDLSKSSTKRQTNDFFVPHRSQQFLIATTSRYKKPVEKPFVIHMFRNGDEKYRGARILLPRKIMGSWEHVLELITQKANLITPAKRICTLDGRMIHAVSEIQDGGKYVALEGSKGFQRVSYCATDEKKLLLARSFPRAAIRLGHKHLTTSDGGGGLNDVGNTTLPLVSKRSRGRGILKRRKSIRPMAGRKNKEGREKAIKDHREDSIFGGSPPLERDLDESIRVPKMPSPPLKSSLTTFQMAADSDKEADQLESSLEEPLRESLPTLTQIQEVNENAGEAAGTLEGNAMTTAGNADSETLPPPSAAKEGGNADGVFHADVEHDPEADTVPEGGEIEVEKPIDQQEAEEVEEEDGAEAGAHQNQTPVQSATAKEDIHLELQRRQTSVDLSLQRTTTSSHDPPTVTQNSGSTNKTTSQGPSKPSSQAPSKPSSKTSSRAPSKPSSQAPSKPSSRTPSKPSSRAPSKPSSQAPSKPSSRAPSKPSSRAPSNPPSKPSSQESNRPMSNPPINSLSKPSSLSTSQGPNKPSSQHTVASQGSDTNANVSSEVLSAQEESREAEGVEQSDEVIEEVVEEVAEETEQVMEETIPEEVEEVGEKEEDTAQQSDEVIEEVLKEVTEETEQVTEETIPEEVEEVGDTAQDSSSPPTPPFSSPQEPEVQEQLEDQT